jgi:Ca2+-transporting ATPase
LGEAVLKMCALESEKKEEIIRTVDEWANRGLKVLAVASKKIPDLGERKIKEEELSNLEWGGIVGLWDPPRKKVKGALAAALDGGLKLKVITGDYRLTAERIMKYLGLRVKPQEVLEGIELDRMDDEELKKGWEKYCCLRALRLTRNFVW